jgi:hypothetical protein
MLAPVRSPRPFPPQALSRGRFHQCSWRPCSDLRPCSLRNLDEHRTPARSRLPRFEASLEPTCGRAFELPLEAPGRPRLVEHLTSRELTDLLRTSPVRLQESPTDTGPIYFGPCVWQQRVWHQGRREAQRVSCQLSVRRPSAPTELVLSLLRPLLRSARSLE